MRVAEILSDLTSLNVCDHEAAKALVSCRPGNSETSDTSSPSRIGQEQQAASKTLSGLNGEDDPDLQRALDLVELHGLKEKHLRGTDEGLVAARREVNSVLADLQQKK